MRPGVVSITGLAFPLRRVRRISSWFVAATCKGERMRIRGRVTGALPHASVERRRMVTYVLHRSQHDRRPVDDVARGRAGAPVHIACDVRGSGCLQVPASAGVPDRVSITYLANLDDARREPQTPGGTDRADLILRVPWPWLRADEMRLVDAHVARPSASLAVPVEPDDTEIAFAMLERLGSPWVAIPAGEDAAAWFEALCRLAALWCRRHGARTVVEPLRTLLAKALSPPGCDEWSFVVIDGASGAHVGEGSWTPSVHAVLTAAPEQATPAFLAACLEVDRAVLERFVSLVGRETREAIVAASRVTVCEPARG
jgi:hypothetical protein